MHARNGTRSECTTVVQPYAELLNYTYVKIHVCRSGFTVSMPRGPVPRQSRPKLVVFKDS